MTPLQLEWSRFLHWTTRGARWFELGALALTVVAVAASTFLTQGQPTLPYMVFAPLAWAAWRLGARGATALSVLFAGVAVEAICRSRQSARNLARWQRSKREPTTTSRSRLASMNWSPARGPSCAAPTGGETRGGCSPVATRPSASTDATFLGQLRKKVEADPARPMYLVTEPGVGYRFARDDG